MTVLVDRLSGPVQEADAIVIDAAFTKSSQQIIQGQDVGSCAFRRNWTVRVLVPSVGSERFFIERHQSDAGRLATQSGSPLYQVVRGSDGTGFPGDQAHAGSALLVARERFLLEVVAPEFLYFLPVDDVFALHGKQNSSGDLRIEGLPRPFHLSWGIIRISRKLSMLRRR